MKRDAFTSAKTSDSLLANLRCSFLAIRAAFCLMAAARMLYIKSFFFSILRGELAIFFYCEGVLNPGVPLLVGALVLFGDCGKFRVIFIRFKIIIIVS
jgi:hypothetical protein